VQLRVDTVASSQPFDAWCADHAPSTSSPDGLVRTNTEALFTAIEDNREAIDQDPAHVPVLVDETVMPYVDVPR
jgi:ABC-type transporter MlaC component